MAAFGSFMEVDNSDSNSEEDKELDRLHKIWTNTDSDNSF